MRTLPTDLRNPELYQFIQSRGFVKFGLFDYELQLRIHVECYLLWSDNFAHFALAARSETGRKGPAGISQEWKIVMIPVPVYTTEKAMEIIKAVQP